MLRGHTFDPLSKRVIGAAIQVHTTLGPGFLESLYEQALKVELKKREIAFEAQKIIKVTYEAQPIGNHVLDLLVEDQLIVELKAVKTLEEIHFPQ